VVDTSGAVYQGVQVVLKELGPQPPPDQTTTTDANGRFSFAALSAGAYELTVSASGFATQTRPVLVHAGESYEAPAIVLSFASTTTQVEVTASRREIASEELHEEEHQRVFGILPNFYIVYAPNAPPLSARQKFHLAWRSEIDPVTLLATGAVAGIQQEADDFKGYGQGASGYGKRFAANYADGFIGTMIGGAILPSILKQDPRYFYKGTGTVRHRALYAIANAVLCKGDNGHWQLDYSSLAGGVASAAISNLYYPASDRNGASLTAENIAYGIGGSAIGNLFQEFLVRKLTPHVPNYDPGKP